MRKRKEDITHAMMDASEPMEMPDEDRVISMDETEADLTVKDEKEKTDKLAERVNTAENQIQHLDTRVEALETGEGKDDKKPEPITEMKQDTLWQYL